LAVVERFADGQASEEKLGFAWGDARRAAQVAHRQGRQTADGTAMWAVSLLCEADVGRALGAVGLAVSCEAISSDPPSLADAQREQASLLRCVFGNPFRPVAVDPPWLSWQGGTVFRLALAAYNERHLPTGTLEPTRLAILADALEEAGCDLTELLGHLRSTGPHVRGCRVVDLVLGKS
jgi:hypothetical protein